MSVRLTFLSLARDCANSFPPFFGLIEALTASGIAARAMIGEDGSQDATRRLIEGRAAAKGDVELFDTSFMAAVRGRFDRMAAGRQALLTQVPRGLPDHFICVADLDNILRVVPAPSAFAGAIAVLDDPALAGVAATSTPLYYDLLALRVPGMFERNVQADLDAARSNPARYYAVHRDLIYRTQREVTAADRLLATSAFNGMCLYRADDYLDGSYTTHGPLSVCEHVPFNQALCAKGDRRILVSRDLTVAMPAEHGPSAAPGFFVRRIVKAGRILSRKLGG